jgi:hypothetical protein
MRTSPEKPSLKILGTDMTGVNFAGTSDSEDDSELTCGCFVDKGDGGGGNCLLGRGRIVEGGPGQSKD